MNKETLKVAYVDFWPEWSIENFIIPILRKHFYVIEDYSQPDIIFHSIFNGMKDISKYNRKIPRVLILAENWRTSQLDTDFSISFDPHSQTNYRLPLWQIYLLLWSELKDQLYNKVQHNSFERFASFVVSNGSNFYRNSAFQSLNNYKYVCSYGRFMNNSNELQQKSEERYWRDAKLEFFKEHPHKFMFAFENTPTKYYCTEKIMDAFLVGSIPIYWGDPKVKEDWNDKAFVNVMELGNNWINEIKRLDQDSSLFKEKYNQPVFTENQKEKLEENLKDFEYWLIKIVQK